MNSGGGNVKQKKPCWEKMGVTARKRPGLIPRARLKHKLEHTIMAAYSPDGGGGGKPDGITEGVMTK